MGRKRPESKNQILLDLNRSLSTRNCTGHTKRLKAEGYISRISSWKNKGIEYF